MASLNHQARAHLLISGRAQGVFFRKHTQERARALGLTGWVKNLEDGRVEIVAEGARAKVEQLLSWARQGPPGAQVEKAQVSWQKPTGQFTDFTIAY